MVDRVLLSLHPHPLLNAHAEHTCRSHCGFQSLSYRMTVSAVCRLRPSPPLRVDARKMVICRCNTNDLGQHSNLDHQVCMSCISSTSTAGNVGQQAAFALQSICDFNENTEAAAGPARARHEWLAIHKRAWLVLSCPTLLPGLLNWLMEIMRCTRLTLPSRRTYLHTQTGTDISMHMHMRTGLLLRQLTS